MPALIVFAQAADAAQRVGEGRIVGGWEYVWAGYALSVLAVGLYAWSLWVRRPSAHGPGHNAGES